MRVQINQGGLKLNGTHHLLFMLIMLVYRAEAYTLKKNTEVSVVASKEIGLEINADKTKCMVITRYLNTGGSRFVNIDNNSFEKVEYFQ